VKSSLAEPTAANKYGHSATSVFLKKKSFFPSHKIVLKYRIFFTKKEKELI
jgi:hypothetical protein